ILDTKIILRFLANDHPEHSAKAKSFFGQAVSGDVILHLSPIVLAECVYVLKGKLYQLTRNEIADLLTKLLEIQGIISQEKDVLFLALSIFAKYNVDFPDAYLAAKSEFESKAIATFNNKDFDKIGVNSIGPS
ncbi:PIN domain-containing protein, partial [Brevibacillus massiliensis]|uniref:PIN domain-containing protein n=1 Tax=Brevibacillus massiliensis TaxID=1118054 RepID=UPI000361D9FF